MKSEQIESTKSEKVSYDRKDFVSDQAIRWCPGCGDYSILAQMQRVMPEICEQSGLKKENIVFVSGIGCSSRFPYYMNSYGFHTIHGRAPTVATGLRVTRPDLQVWVITGDGDSLSIGGNHLIHCLRRNIDVKILLFNNRIYGLTKGQYSPTSEMGKITKSSPYGSIEKPINPLSVAIASKTSFIARTYDTNPSHLRETLLRAAKHKGTAFVEILQNCNVFNDGAFSEVTDKATNSENAIYLEDKKPMLFGKDMDKAIALQKNESNNFDPVVVNVKEADPSDILIHDESSSSAAQAYAVTHLDLPEFPLPMGVFRSIDKPVYGDLLNEQVAEVTTKLGKGDFFNHLKNADTWQV